MIVASLETSLVHDGWGWSPECDGWKKARVSLARRFFISAAGTTRSPGRNLKEMKISRRFTCNPKTLAFIKIRINCWQLATTCISPRSPEPPPGTEPRTPDPDPRSWARSGRPHPDPQPPRHETQGGKIRSWTWTRLNKKELWPVWLEPCHACSLMHFRAHVWMDIVHFH